MLNHYLNEKLTLKEKGMIATFQAHAEHLSTNRISHTHIYFACSEGNTTIKNTLKSLIKKRIITKERIFNNGQLLETNYSLSVDDKKNPLAMGQGWQVCNGN